MSTLTLVILLINVFLMGVVTVIATRFIRAHYQQKNDNVVAPRPDLPEPDFPKLQIPKEIIDRITKESEEHYRRVVANSATYLQQGLVESATDVNAMVKNMVTQIINQELAQYRQDMDKMRQQSEAQIGGVQQEMESHKAELRANLAKEIAAEKQQLLKQIDTRLSDAVASFLIETLGHNVDLGNQNDYLTSLLEENKAVFVKEVATDQANDQKVEPQPAATQSEPASQSTPVEAVTEPTSTAPVQGKSAEPVVVPISEEKEVPSEAKAAN